MPYKVQVKLIGPNGLTVGKTRVILVASEREAFDVLRREASVAFWMGQPTQFSVLGQDAELLLVYSSPSGDPKAVSAAVW